MSGNDSIIIIDNIQYQLLTAEYLEEAIQCVAYTFGTSEPMAVALGHSQEEYLEFAKYFAGVALEQRLGHIAIDTNTGKIIGVIISEDYSKSFFATLPDKVTSNKKLGRVIKVLDSLHEKFFHLEPEREKEIKNSQSFGKILHWNCTSVYAEYRGKRIASQLTRIHFDHAKNVMGYKGSVVECTSHISKAIAEQNNFVSKAIVKYSEYETNHLETGELYKPFEQITLKNPKNDGCHLMWLEQFQ